jgi:pimeloyl-ACP methyl ester carboxylesterase
MNKTVKRSLVAGAAITAAALINNALFANAKALGNPLGGEGRFWPWRDGDVFYTRRGDGDLPVVLLHGIYAGASIYEWRKNFAALSEGPFTVYALDWLGFGLSDKPKIRYTGRAYVEMLAGFLQEVVGRPCALVASSLAAAYAIEAARLAPNLAKSLVLVCPTGMTRLASRAGSPASDLMYRFLSLPLIGTSLYNGLTSRVSLRTYLENQAYFDPSYVTDEVVDQYSAATHQYGSQYATLCFVSGTLDHSVRESLPKLKQESIRVIWGREARMTPLSDAEAFLAANGNAELTVFDKAGLLPHDEQAIAFNRLVSGALSSFLTDGKKPKKAGRKKAG